MSIPDNVDKVAHAIAISECRDLFPLSSILPKGTRFSLPSCVGSSPTGRLIERKFLGAHSDIGGGYSENLASLAPLWWIVNQAKTAGIEMGKIDVDKYFNTTPGIIYHKSDVPLGDPHLLGRRPFPCGLRKTYYYE
jgi:hypothetical protein